MSSNRFQDGQRVLLAPVTDKKDFSIYDVDPVAFESIYGPVKIRKWEECSTCIYHYFVEDSTGKKIRVPECMIMAVDIFELSDALFEV